MQEFKMEQLQEDLLLSLHNRFPNTIDDNAKLFVEEIGFEKGKAHGCIYSGKASIINEKKGIRLNFKIWFSVYCDAYTAPNIKPNIETYLTGEYIKIQETSISRPELGLDAVILLNVPESKKMFEDDPKKKTYFDAYWHAFKTDKENYVLSKEGWFGFYVYDSVVGMRLAREDEWVDVPSEKGQKLKEGLEMVRSDDPSDPFRNLVKEFMAKRYQEKMAPDMYVEL